MMKAVIQYADGTYLRVEWEDGRCILEGKIDTVYESDNGLEEEEDGYREFYACAFRVEDIVNDPDEKACHVGCLIEISIENEPTLIALGDGRIIWRK